MERIIRTTGLLMAALVLAGGGFAAPVQASAPLADVQKAAAAWAEVRTETIGLESDWISQKALLHSTLGALQERVRQLEERRAALEVKTAGGRRETEELVARRQALAEATDEATRRLLELDERLVRLRPWLPPRLSAALELPYRSLAAEELTLGERTQHTTTILNRCVHFNSTVTGGEEVVLAADGESRLMEVVYWGLSHGYALDRAGDVAYAGAPAANGWEWTPAPGLAKAVGRLIAVAADKTEPEFVVAPVRPGDPITLESTR
jgi:hypothetical protein